MWDDFFYRNGLFFKDEGYIYFEVVCVCGGVCLVERERLRKSE